MRNPGDYTLPDLSVTTPLSSVALPPILDLAGIKAATIEARFSYGNGGTSAKAYVQTTLDAGLSWLDVASFAFTTSSATKVINLSGLTPRTTAVTPTDGALADDTCVDGILGDAFRVKLTTTGTFDNTHLAVRMAAR